MCDIPLLREPDVTVFGVDFGGEAFWTFREEMEEMLDDQSHAILERSRRAVFFIKTRSTVLDSLISSYAGTYGPLPMLANDVKTWKTWDLPEILRLYDDSPGKQTDRPAGRKPICNCQ
jgi:hypothetical protein